MGLQTWLCTLSEIVGNSKDSLEKENTGKNTSIELSEYTRKFDLLLLHGICSCGQLAKFS